MSEDQWNNNELDKQRDISVDNFKTRMNICKNCENLNSINLCTICGCFMPLKTRLSFAKCPKDKWQSSH